MRKPPISEAGRLGRAGPHDVRFESSERIQLGPVNGFSLFTLGTPAQR